MSSFWEGKKPCWGVLDCSKYVYQNCPAYLYPEQACWEIAYTNCEALLGIKKDCQTCKVFKLYSKTKADVPFTVRKKNDHS